MRSYLLLAICLAVVTVFVMMADPWGWFQAESSASVASHIEPEVESADHTIDANEPDQAEPQYSQPEDNPQDQHQLTDFQPESEKVQDSEAEENQDDQETEQEETLESLNLNNVEMRHLVQKIADWTGKVVIPSDDSMQLRITIYSPNKVPRKQALQLIYSAMRTKGFVAEDTPNIIYIKPISKAAIGYVPTISADRPLASVEDKGTVVQKIFRIKNNSPSHISSIIQHMIGDYGHMSSDDNSKTIMVIETVENLIRIEGVIRQFDVTESDRKITEIFNLEHADAVEIVQLLQVILSQGNAGSGNRGTQQKGNSPGSENIVILRETEIPTILIPESKRRWIIASAEKDKMEVIRHWIEQLDIPEEEKQDSETVQLRYVQAQEVATQLTQALSHLPGTGIRANVMIQPLAQSQQVMIFGREENRRMVRQLIAEIDVPSGKFETRVFRIQYADPEQIQNNIESLYDQDSSANQWPLRSFRSSPADPASVVKAVAFPSMQQVTVIASAEKLEQIAEKIAEWDVPIDLDDVRPRIYELQNTDPVRMANLLSNLFSEEVAQATMPFWWYGGSQQTDKRKIVGPLYGQLTFQAVPDSKKIVVISKVPEAYKVIEEMILELDRREMAEVPEIVTLKYADPENLAERLNAMFNESGTVATIRLSERGLRDYSMSQPQQQSTQNQQPQPGEYTPWWTTAQRTTDQMPISNVIGRIRFIPDRRTKAVLVLAPREFMSRIVETIKELDTPGKQVRVQAVILEVNHRKLTSLGIKLASDRQAFGELNENAILALSRLTLLEERGSLTFATTAEVNAVIDFLMRYTDARILNQQTLWTKDNEEADFFKGRTVAFITSAQTSPELTSIRQEFEFERVGMTLRIRPSITPERNVDMTINIILSQLTQELINTQPVRTEMETQTTMIVQDGETIMLGGMLFQNDLLIQRKIPFIGDLPLIGGLFRHSDVEKTNDEMLVFITPHVIEEDIEKLSEGIRLELDDSMRKLEENRQILDETILIKSSPKTERVSSGTERNDLCD